MMLASFSFSRADRVTATTNNMERVVVVFSGQKMDKQKDEQKDKWSAQDKQQEEVFLFFKVEDRQTKRPEK